MAYVMVGEVDTFGAPAPTRSEIVFDLPGGGTDPEVIVVARGIRNAFRAAYDTRVRVVSLQQTGLTRDITLGT